METEIRDNHGRFAKGNPGGPGRPAISVVSVLRKKLGEIPDGDTRTLMEIIVDEYLADIRARKDGVAVRDLIDRFDGKPKQGIELSGDADKPIGIQVVRYSDRGTDTETSSS